MEKGGKKKREPKEIVIKKSTWGTLYTILEGVNTLTDLDTVLGIYKDLQTMK